MSKDLDTDMDFGANEQKLTPEGQTKAKEVEDFDSELVGKFTGGDQGDDWFDDTEESLDVDEDDEISEGVGDKEIEETEAEETKKTEKSEKTEKEVAVDEEAEKIKETLIQHIKGEDGTGSTVFKVRGKDYNLEDLTPDEIKGYFSKGGAFYEEMENLSVQRKSIEQKELELNTQIQQTRELMNRQRSDVGGGADEVARPSALSHSEEDTEVERALKDINFELMKKIDKIERSSIEQSNSSYGERVLREIDQWKGEYPVASEEEVIAIISQYPNIPVRDAMAASNKHYLSDDYTSRVFNARPDLVKKIEEAGVQKYLARSKKTSGLPARRPSNKSAGERISGKKQKRISNFDDIEARKPEMLAALGGKNPFLDD